MTVSRPGPAFSPPGNLQWLAAREDGRRWLKSLPDLQEKACSRFELDISGPPFSGGNVSYVLPVTYQGEDAVLKLHFADRESRYEADALKLWNGDGAIRVLAHARDLGAILLERCRPGQFLADDSETDTVGVLASLLRKLLVPASAPFSPLTDEAGRWLTTLRTDWENSGKPCENRLVDAAATALSDLVRNEAETVLLHQDLHGHNVLSAQRAPWLAIDPKPLVGDPAFCVSPIVRSFELGHSARAAWYRLERLSEELEIDCERGRLWTIGQTMAWAFSSNHPERHFDTVRWLLQKPG